MSMAALKAIQNERGHWEKDFGSVKQHTPADCPKCLRVENARLQEKVAWMQAGILETVVPWNLASQHTLNMMCDTYQAGKREVRRYKALAERRKEALEECQQIATDRIRTADAAVKQDIYAADALMGIAKVARAAIEEKP